jgi:hypothetical protein
LLIRRKIRTRLSVTDFLTGHRLEPLRRVNCTAPLEAAFQQVNTAAIFGQWTICGNGLTEAIEMPLRSQTAIKETISAWNFN